MEHNSNAREAACLEVKQLKDGLYSLRVWLPKTKVEIGDTVSTPTFWKNKKGELVHGLFEVVEILEVRDHKGVFKKEEISLKKNSIYVLNCRIIECSLSEEAPDIKKKGVQA